MKNYYRIMLGQHSMYAQECFQGNYIGTHLGINTDLTNNLPDDWRSFNQKFIPVFQQNYPGKSKISAGLACGALWTIAKGLKIGDIVLCPTGQGSYMAGEITGEYSFHSGEQIPHHRNVKWYPKPIERNSMSEALQNSTGSIGTVSDVSRHAEELERLIAGNLPSTLISTDETVEDPSIFALEKHLEDFLVANWTQTDLGTKYDIYSEDGEAVGQQYPTDTGPIDILAVSKDKKELLVVELKRGRATDVVVGQTQRYMGYVQEELAEDTQTVKGIIIALEDDIRLKRALSVARNITFYRYQVSFKLIRGVTP